MGFQSGSISMRRFAVLGTGPREVMDGELAKLSAHAFRASDVGVPEEVEYGWSGGRHVYDDAFAFEGNVFAGCLIFALRVDTNKVPAEIKKAKTLQAEASFAAGNPSGFITKQQRREAREIVRKELDDELRSGKHRRSRLVPVLWDLENAALYSPASAADSERLAEIFERTFGLALTPVTSGTLAEHVMESTGRRRAYEDLRPTRFVMGPEGEHQHPEYPWVAKGPQPKDFLGNEFLTWLWYGAAHGRDSVAVSEDRDVTVYFDRSLHLECAYGMTGRDAIQGDGATRTPEAMEALRLGKLPRKASLLLHAAGNQYALTLSAESLGVGSMKLPEVEDAETARALFEERIAMVRDFWRSVDGLFRLFLVERTGPGWERLSLEIGEWATAGRSEALVGTDG